MKSLFLIALLFSLSNPAWSAEPLSLEDAVQRALLSDVWLEGSELREQAMQAESIAAGELPDPVFNLGVRNLPQDSFSLSREPMTQVTLGVTQQFPRGETRKLERERLAQLSEVEPVLRSERVLKVTATVADIWLSAYLADQTARLITADRRLFEHLVDVAESSYSSALGRTRQQDLIRAQLELSRLDENLISLQEAYGRHRGQLARWVGYLDDSSVLTYLPVVSSEGVPEVAHSLVRRLLDRNAEPAFVESQIVQHPRVAVIDRQIEIGSTNIDLAHQSYKPQWGLSTSYAYRDDDRVERDDFVSIGLSFDLPVFTGRRQDQKVVSATRQLEALKLERVLVLRELRADLEAKLAEYHRLSDRRAFYVDRLLKEMDEQAEASLQAYTNDDGDFAEAVRARIANLNARIEVLGIDVALARLESQFNYLLALPADKGIKQYEEVSDDE